MIKPVRKCTGSPIRRFVRSSRSKERSMRKSQPSELSNAAKVLKMAIFG